MSTTAAPATVPGFVSSAVFEARPDAVSEARRFVGATVDDTGVDPATRYSAELLVSELATNVLIHTSSTHFCVEVAVCGTQMRVDVREDTASDVTALVGRAETPAIDATHGRGLTIVDWTARLWGMTRTDRTTTAWFVLDLATT